MVELWQAIEAG